jgi:hypothetical protein
VRDQGWEAVHIVLDDHVGPRTVEDRLELRLTVGGAVDQGCPDRLDERRELLDRRLAELGRRLGDEVGPELARVLLAFCGRRQVDQVFLEPERLEPPLPRRLGREHDAMPASLQDLADADAVVRWAVGTLGHEQDREPIVGHLVRPPRAVTWTA